MRMTSITLTELDNGHFKLSYSCNGGWNGATTYQQSVSSRHAPLPRALRRLRMLMSIHEIPTATIKTLTDGEREVTLEEVIHMRKSLTRMLKEGGGQ